MQPLLREYYVQFFYQIHAFLAHFFIIGLHFHDTVHDHLLCHCVWINPYINTRQCLSCDFCQIFCFGMDICQSCWQTDGTAEFIQGIPFCILFVDGQYNKDTIGNNLAVKMTVFFCAWQSAKAFSPQRMIGTAHMELKAIPMASLWAGISFLEEIVHS